MSENSENLDRLVASLGQGDRSAFTPVFHALWPRVRALCVSLLHHSEDADDAAQQAMEKILTRASEYQPSRPALPWALAIAAWECRTLRRRVHRRREVSDEDHFELDPCAPADEALARRELQVRAVEALNELSPADRETLFTTYWEEAQSAATPALRKRRQRALERLRTAFRRLYEAD